MSSLHSMLPTVIIPVHNAPDELQQCLASVAATVPGDAEVIVIDEGSIFPRKTLNPGIALRFTIPRSEHDLHRRSHSARAILGARRAPS